MKIVCFIILANYLGESLCSFSMTNEFPRSVWKSSMHKLLTPALGLIFMQHLWDEYDLSFHLLVLCWFCFGNNFHFDLSGPWPAAVESHWVIAWDTIIKTAYTGAYFLWAVANTGRFFQSKSLRLLRARTQKVVKLELSGALRHLLHNYFLSPDTQPKCQHCYQIKQSPLRTNCL